MSELPQLSVTELQAGLRSGDYSAREVIEAVLERAQVLSEEVNPFLEVLADEARARARAEDARIRDGSQGPLSGIPVSVKDHIWVRGARSAAGAEVFREFRAPRTCAAISRLEERGAIVFAKTAQSEFGFLASGYSPVHGQTRNPRDAVRSPGGSSAGAAACLAAGLGPLAIGSDGGGSIRIPAAYCGTVGFKPSFGLVPRKPGFDIWNSLNVLGPLAQRVQDARIAVEAMAGIDQEDRQSGLDLAEPPPIDVELLRLVAFDGSGTTRVDGDVRQAFHRTVSLLQSQGASVSWDDPGLSPSGDEWTTIAASESFFTHGSLLASQNAALGSEAQEFLRLGQRFTLEDYYRAEQARERILSAYLDLFQRHRAHAFLTPTMPSEATLLSEGVARRDGQGVSHLALDDSDRLVLDASLTGFPACAIPMGLGASGLPLSLQVIGRRGHDRLVLQVAAMSESLIAAAGHWQAQQRSST